MSRAAGHALERHVLVAGGGLAGLTAANALARGGARVTLLEAGSHLGGRMSAGETFSFDHAGRRFTFPIEHGIHGFWRQYRNLRNLMATLDVARHLVPAPTQELLFATDESRIGFVDIGERIRGSHLPDVLAQLSLYRDWAFLRAALGPGVQRHARALRELLHAVAFEPEDIAFYDRYSVEDLILDWPPILKRFFTALTHVGFFGEPDEVSLSAFFAGLSLYAISDKRDSGFDVLEIGSDAALLAPLARSIEQRGGRILTSTRAERLEAGPHGGIARVRVCGADRVSSTINADAFVLALDPPGFRVLLDASPPAAEMLGLEGRAIPRGHPSTVVRLWYEREPPPERASAGVFAGLEADNFFWLHRLQRPFSEWKAATGGGVVECHLYGRRALESMALGDSIVIARVAASVERAWPRVAGSLAAAHVRRNAKTHVAFEPGTYANRLDVATLAANVALAGDWIRAPWEVLYMERACVTGLSAARTLARSLGLDIDAMPTIIPPFPAAKSVALVRPIIRTMRSRGFLPSPRTPAFRAHLPS